MIINKKLLYTLENRFDKIQAYLDRVFQFEEDEDLYSFVASIMYDKDIAECKELNPDGTPNPEGKELRNRAKQFILPVVAECGGLTDDTVDLESEIKHHRKAAIQFRNSVITADPPKNEDERRNAKEVLDQADGCDQIANWLEELLAFRSERRSKE